MSKTQDKRAQRADEAAAFVAARLSINLAMFERNFEAGQKLYLDNKDRLSPEECEAIEVEMVKTKGLIDEIKLRASKLSQPKA